MHVTTFAQFTVNRVVLYEACSCHSGPRQFPIPVRGGLTHHYHRSKVASHPFRESVCKHYREAGSKVLICGLCRVAKYNHGRVRIPTSSSHHHCIQFAQISAFEKAMRKREGVDFTSGVSILISGLGQQHQVGFLPALRPLLGDESLAYIRCATYYERNLCRYFCFKAAAIRSAQCAHVAGQKQRPHLQGQDGPLCGYYQYFVIYFIVYTTKKGLFSNTPPMQQEKRKPAKI